MQELIRFGEDFELDVSARLLRRRGHGLKLERIPLEILVLLLEHRGKIVSRDEIVAKVWGKGVFLDTDNGIRGAIRKIRQKLKDDPEHPRFIQTVRGQGYRFIATVIRTNGNPEDTSAQPSALLEGFPIYREVEDKRGAVYALVSEFAARWQGRNNQVPGRTLLAGRWLVLLGVVALALFAVAHIMALRGAEDVARHGIKSLAVLPLKNLSGDSTQEYLADGMTEALIGRLSSIRDLRVISRTSVMRFKDTGLSVPEIAKMLRVDAIVEGSVMRVGSRIRVSAQLIRAVTDDHYWSETYDRELRDALALESEVAQSIAGRVEVTLTREEHKRLTALRSISPEVYESYLKGQFALDQSTSSASVEESLDYFEHAIENDPTFAPPYVGLARAYASLSTIFVGGASPNETRPKAISAALKALELDPELAEAHTLLADAYQKQWQWAEAEAEHRRALELTPGDARAQAGFANWLLCQGRINEALVWAQRAREHDPLSVSGVSIGWILFHARRYDDAVQEFRSALALHPDDASDLWYLGFALIGKGQYAEAIPVLEKTVSIMDRSPGSLELLATAYAHAGRRADALTLIDELKRSKERGYVPAGAFINPYLALGDYEQAFAWFESAYQEKSNILQFLRVHPFFDPVRGDPRFKELLRRVGLD